MQNSFWQIGLKYAKKNPSGSQKEGLRTFVAFFGCKPEICTLIWCKIGDDLPDGSMPKHLLWCLMFLKRYQIERANAALVNVDEKTFRKWTWTFIHLISNLDVVSSFFL